MKNWRQGGRRQEAGVNALCVSSLRGMKHSRKQLKIKTLH